MFLKGFFLTILILVIDKAINKIKKMTEKITFEKSEIFPFITQLGKIFSFVRLVDVGAKTQYVVGADGEIVSQKANEESIAPESIASRALATKSQINKFEFLKQKIFFVTAKYITIDAKDYVLESVTEVNNESLFKSFTKDDFIKRYNEYNSENYQDDLTPCYNKRYYDEHKSTLNKATAIVRIDLDLYKQIGKVYGNIVADAALRSVGSTIQKCVRKSDTVIRLEDEKFLVFFYGMKRNITKSKLEEIRSTIENSSIPQHPAIKLTVSIGGYYSDKLVVNDLKNAEALLQEARKELNKVVVN